MNTSEWLDARVDLATARYNADPRLGNKVDVNQTMLAELVVAAKSMDKRLARIEAQLGFDPFNFTS